jgi:hypothetical protein
MDLWFTKSYLLRVEPVQLEDKLPGIEQVAEQLECLILREIRIQNVHVVHHALRVANIRPVNVKKL